MAEKDWLQTVQDWLSLASAERGLNAADEWADRVGGAPAGATMRGITAIPRMGIKGVELGGKAIGGVAGGLAQDLTVTPEDFEAAYRNGGVKPKPTLEERFGIMSDASEAGGQAAKENITVLDVASMGAGAGANMALRGGALGLARGLNAADLGLAGVDAAIGAGEVVQGSRKGDWGRVAGGVARVAGNAAGGLATRETAKNIEDLTRLGIKVTQPDAPTSIEFERPTRWPVNKEGVAPPAYDPETGASEPKAPRFTTEGKMRSDTTGSEYTFEARTPEGAKAAKKIQSNPEAMRSYTEMADFIDSVSMAGAEELVGRVGVAREAANMDDPLDVIYGHTGNFRGFTLGGGEYGHTKIYEPGGEVAVVDPKGKGYYMNTYNIAQYAKRNAGLMLDGDIDPALLARATADLPPDLAQYVQQSRQGGQRTPELDRKVELELFRQKLVYTALHEAIGHTIGDTMHAPGAPKYKGYTYTRDAKEIEGGPRQIGLDEDGTKTGFEPAHNAVTTALKDPEALKQLKALMEGPTFQARLGEWYSAALGDGKGFRDAVAKRTDRVMGRAEARDARVQFDEPATPPDPNAPLGPALPPLAERIKRSLVDQQRAAMAAEMQRKDLLNARAARLRELKDQLLSRQIDMPTYEAARKRAMSGSMDLVDTVNRMPITEAEKAGMIERILTQAQDDQFIQSRLQDSFNKMINGERLQDAEIADMRQFLNQRVADSKKSALENFGEFFANATGGIRAWRTAWDLSAAGRQALFASVMNPGATKSAFKAQIEALKMSPAEFETLMIRLRDKDINPFAEVAQAAGLHFSESMSKEVAGIKMEEAFSHGKWAEKLPGVRRSEQAYIAYLNKMRVELFNKHMMQFMEDGTPIFDQYGGVTQPVKDLAYMVNTLTGRGELSLFHISPNSPLGRKLGGGREWTPGKKTADQLHTALTTVFFAPRFQASRFALMRDASMALVGGNLDPKVYRIYMKNLYGTLAAITSTMGMLAATGVGTFETDPRKRDFGVLKVGNVRYDAYGSLKQWAALIAHLGEDAAWKHPIGYKHRMGEKNRYVWQFGKSKASPTASLILSAITGEDYLGRPAEAGQLARSTALPMIAETIYEIIKEGEADQLAAAVPASVIGIGVNAYDSRKR